MPPPLCTNILQILFSEKFSRNLQGHFIFVLYIKMTSDWLVLGCISYSVNSLILNFSSSQYKWIIINVIKVFKLKNIALIMRKLPLNGFPGGSAGKESTCQSRRCSQSLGQKDPLEEEMVTYSSILAWKIPWTEESGRLQSLESQRIRNDWAHKHVPLNLLFMTLSFLLWYRHKLLDFLMIDTLIF